MYCRAMNSSTSAEIVEYDRFDGAYIVHASSGRTIETWGEDHPVLAIRAPSTHRRVAVWLEARSSDWARFAAAIRDGERYETHMEGKVRPGLSGERAANIHVFIGRTTSGRILISLRPLDRADGDAAQVRLPPEAAHRLGIAMAQCDHRTRRALVFDALREHTEEIVNVRNR